MEFEVKIRKNFRYKKRILVIRENDFQIQKVIKDDKKKKKKENEIKTYSLSDALVLDKTENKEFEIFIATKDYKLTITPLNLEDKVKIFHNLEKITKKFTFQNVYKDYNEKMAQYGDKDNEISPQDFLTARLFLFKDLMNEMNQKIEEFKPHIKQKPKSKTESEMLRIYKNTLELIEEMDKQFQVILTYTNNYFEITEKYKKGSLKRLNTIITVMEKKENNNYKENDLSSEDSNKHTIVKNTNEENNEKIIQENFDNINKEKTEIVNQEKIENLNQEKNKEIIQEQIEEINNEKIENKDQLMIKNEIIIDNNNNSQYKFLSYNKKDFHNDLYNFPKREKYNINLKYPKNIVKEMIASATQNKPAPVYFNEPLSICQKQCEQFLYLDLLKKVADESKNKSLQLGYISAFIIGEIFLGLSRNLKPFNAIIGETYEFFDNKNQFRYYSEQVCHKPQITAFIGETPEFALYGDTKNSTSFKILKGAMELSFKNKIHLHIKTTNDHFTYNKPNIMIKGFLKPPIHNDYSGTTIIENELFPENKAEIKFIEESWTNSTLGLFEGKIYNDNKIVYLIKGNWTDKIYLIENDNKENQIELLKIEKNQEYLKNGNDNNYFLPKFCYNLNYMDKNLEKNLPKNDSRFRMDMRFLEEKEETDEAQKYKEKYEEKQRKELNNDKHKILFFEEKFNDETGENYFIPNGKYWELKKNNQLQNNINSDIFDVSKF